MSDAFLFGGIERVVSILTNELIKYKEKYEITILSLFKSQSVTFCDYGNNVKIKNIFEGKCPDLRKNYLKVRKGLKKYIENNDIDILIVEAAGLACFSYPITRRKDIKTIVCEHVGFDNSKRFGLGWLGRRIGCYYCEGIVVVTEADLARFKKNIKKINRIEQIYNPIDPSICTYNYNLFSKLIVTCGRLSAEKGHDLLIEAARYVFKKHSDWQLDIFGDGPERLNLEKKITKYSLSNNIKLRGIVNNVYEKYKDYSFYVMSSRYEAFGMVLVEALKTGLPVISFDCPYGPNEIILNNTNGLLVDCLDVQQLAEKMNFLIEHEDLRKELSYNSMAGLDRFELTAITSRWINLFDTI